MREYFTADNVKYLVSLLVLIIMEKALILLKIECLGEDCIEEVLNRVKQRSEVKEAGMTFGEFDV